MKKIVFIGISLMMFGYAYAQDWGKVKWVDDGDTILLEDKRRIRYVGVNAPEIAHEKQKAQPFGDEARDFNRTLVFQKAVRLEFDKEFTDQYGRTLAHVFLEDGSLVGAKIVEAGYAFVLPCSPPCKYDDLLLSFQRQAMTAGKGIWSNWTEDGSTYIGNQNSKRFHKRTCAQGQKTSLRNKVIFSKKWDAFWAGFAPCRICLNPSKE